MKKCTQCGAVKEKKDFSKAKHGKDGLKSQCKDCSRSYEMQRVYGITLDTYDAMLAAQNGRCAICNTETTKGRFAIDHCHTTGKVRGLLCFDCNTGIGKLKDDPSLLLTAYNYLTNEEKGHRRPVQ